MILDSLLQASSRSYLADCKNKVLNANVLRDVRDKKVKVTSPRQHWRTVWICRSNGTVSIVERIYQKQGIPTFHFPRIYVYPPSLATLVPSQVGKEVVNKSTENETRWHDCGIPIAYKNVCLKKNSIIFFFWACKLVATLRTAQEHGVSMLIR